MNSDIKKEFNRLKRLKQNQNKPDSYIEKLAKVKLRVRDFKKSNFFANDEEQKLGTKKYEDYLKNYELESISELNNLEQLVKNEILLYRYQNRLNDFEKENILPDERTIRTYNDIQNQILKLKDKLHIDKEDKKEDELTGLQTLRKRFERHINFSKHEFTCTCSNCGNLLLLRRRVKDFDCLVHPFFSGRFWYNARAMKLVRDGVLSKENYANIFYTSVDYVNWCLEHEDEIIDLPNFSKEDTDKYIKKNPYLKK